MKNGCLLLVMILGFIGLISTGCEPDENNGSGLVKLDVEQKYRAEELVVKFDSVISDSRCPIGLVCFWAGNAAVRLNYSYSDNYDVDFILNTHRNFRNDTLINGYRIRLVDVYPYPQKDKKIDPNDYKVELEIDLGK